MVLTKPDQPDRLLRPCGLISHGGILIPSDLSVCLLRLYHGIYTSDNATAFSLYSNSAV